MSARQTAPHGTASAARRHYRHGEPPCEPCRTAANRARAERLGRGADYRVAEPEASGPARNGVPEREYHWRTRTYSWAAEQIRRAESIYGAPETGRRQRRLAEGLPRHIVWGHGKAPSGTGWDAYNAQHDGPYSTRQTDREAV